MRASQMRSRMGAYAMVRSANASGLDRSSFIPNDSDKELYAGFEASGEILDCIVAEMSHWTGDYSDSGYYVYTIEDPDGDVVDNSGQDSWTSMDDAIDAAIEHCDDIAANPDFYGLSKTERRRTPNCRIGKGAAASRMKSSYNSKECFDLVDRLEHETFNYLERRQRNSDYELTEDALFILAVDRVYDSLSDYQLLELYRYFNGGDATVKHLTVKQTTQVLDTIADMAMSHFDDLKTGHVKTSYTDF